MLGEVITSRGQTSGLDLIHDWDTMTLLTIGNVKRRNNLACIAVASIICFLTFTLAGSEKVDGSLAVSLQPRELAAGQWGVLVIDQISRDNRTMVELKERGSLEGRALYAKKIDIVDNLGA